MIHFLDEFSRQKLCDLFADGPALLLVKATQALLHRLDLQGMLGDFPRNVWHVRGFPHEDISIGAEKVDECTFLFGGKRGADAHHFALRVVGVYEDLLGALHRLERPGRPLGVGRFFNDLLPDGRELFGGDNRRGMFAAPGLALIGALEGGDDPAWTQHLEL